MTATEVTADAAITPYAAAVEQHRAAWTGFPVADIVAQAVAFATTLAALAGDNTTPAALDALINATLAPKLQATADTVSAENRATPVPTIRPIQVGLSNSHSAPSGFVPVGSNPRGSVTHLPSLLIVTGYLSLSVIAKEF